MSGQGKYVIGYQQPHVRLRHNAWEYLCPTLFDLVIHVQPPQYFGTGGMSNVDLRYGSHFAMSARPIPTGYTESELKRWETQIFYHCGSDGNTSGMYRNFSIEFCPINTDPICTTSTQPWALLSQQDRPSCRVRRLCESPLGQEAVMTVPL